MFFFNFLKNSAFLFIWKSLKQFVQFMTLFTTIL